MENLYPPVNFPCTEKLENLKEYFSSYADLCNLQLSAGAANGQYTEQLVHNQLVDILSEIKPNEIFDLSDNCSINKLSIPGEVPQKEVHVTNKYAMKLQRDYGITESAKKLETIQAKLKYANCNPRKKEFENIILTHRCSPSKELLPGSEILLVVRVYQPFVASSDRSKYTRYDRLKCSHEIVILGRQTLADLRDKILCASENGFSIEAKSLEDNEPNKNVKEEYPSGLICIENVLYNDFRHPNAVDYSGVVKQWGKDKKVCEFSTNNMEKVCIQDISFRLGYPYVYQHRGDCEHIIVFDDARLLKQCDPLCLSDYPYYHTINRYNAQHCNICHVSIANWMSIDSDRLPHDRTFLCQECHASYNFIDGKRVGTFKAYPYYDKSLVI